MKQNPSAVTPDRIIPLPEMAILTARTPKTLWRWWAVEGVFPKPILMNGRCLGWKESTYNEWLSEKAGV